MHIVHAPGCGTRTTGTWHVGNHGIFGQTGGVTASRCEASLPFCPSRPQAERRGERAQRDRAGARQRSGYRHGESDQATAYTAPQRRQRKVGAESIKGLRSQQLGQTAYFPSSAAAGGASSGLRRTSDHIGGRSGRICRNLRGIRSSRLLTSRTVSSGVSSTTRYHAPRRSGQSIPARTRAQYCTCGILALSVPRSTDECQGPRTGRLRVPYHVGSRRIETVTSDTGSTFQMPIRRRTDEGPPRAVGRLS